MKRSCPPLIGVFRFVGLCLLLCFLCGVGSATTPEPDHRASLDWDAVGNICRLKWPGVPGRTYFMQYTPDLLQDWIWIPVVESGNGETKTWAFDVAGEKGFWRLVSSDIPTEDPPGDDFDGDGVSNLAELLQGTHPLENLDNDHDGFPDDWETGAGLNPSDPADGADADSDGDGLTNAEERLGGTLMQNPDSDGDGVEDGRDGWAKNASLSPVRLPRSSYAVLALDQLGLPYIAPDKLYEALYTADMNDQGLIRMKDASGGFFFVPSTGQVFRYPAGHTFRSYARISNAGTMVSTFGSNGTGLWHYRGTWTPAVPHVGPLGPGEPHHYLMPYGAACTNASGSLVAEITGQSVQDPPPYNNPTYAEKWGYDGHGFWSADVTQPPGAAHHYHYRFYYDFGTNKFNQITTGGTWLSPRHLNDQNLALGSVRQVVGGTRSSAEQFSDGPTGQFIIQTVGPGLVEAGGAPQILPGGIGAWADLSSQDSTYIVGGREIGYTGYYEPLLWQKREGAWQMTSLAGTLADMNFVWDVNSRAQFIGSIQRGDEYREVLVENGAVVDLDEKLASTGWKDVFPQLITESGVILAAATKTQDQTLHGVLLVPMDIAVDANRDGTIKFAGNFNAPETQGKSMDKTEEAKPFSFWLNNDDDKVDGTEQVPAQTPDNQYAFIEGKRDLEDFTRLHLYFGGLQDAIALGDVRVGLEWKNFTGTPAIWLHRAADPNGTEDYLTNKDNEGVANNQIGGAYGVAIGKVAHNAPLQLDNTVFKFLSTTNPNAYFIFDGAGEGKGQLVVTLWKGGQKIGEGPGVWLDLKDIKKMYVRYTGNQFAGPTWDETNDTVIFVHGWRMSPEGRSEFAESFYKRLWHRGFKGRFAAFQWETYYNAADWQWLPFVGGAINAYLGYYNDSEFIAWQSAAELKTFVGGLPGDRKHLAAHSMGNIVAGEAIRQGLQLNNYVMMQAAVPAACYDEDEGRIRRTQTYDQTAGPLTFTMWDQPSPDGDTDPLTREVAYRGRFKDLNQSANVTNMYLLSDYATSFAWEVNNDQAKPNDGAFAYPYRYVPTNANGQKLYRFRIAGDPGIMYYLSGPGDIQSYEAMSYACRTWGRVAGAENRTEGSISNRVNLNGAQFNLPGEFSGFGDEHSAQFNIRIQHLKPFYNELINRFGLGPANP